MQDTPLTSPLFEAHPRTYAANRYVYPVLSRRAGGISIGVNLNLDQFCNFHCIYCQVDRSKPCEKEAVDIERLADELNRMVELVVSGRIFEGPQFRATPPALRRLNDIALSGDGEPTTCPQFKEAVVLAIRAKGEAGLAQLKIVIITNASMLHRPKVKEALSLLDRHNGEIWAKLDAGTENYYKLVDVTKIPFRKILDNILDAARLRPIAIQSLFMRIRGVPPDEKEITAYCNRLREITAKGGRIHLVQVYTVARRPAQPYITPLSNEEVETIAQQVRKIPLAVAVFYGSPEV